MDMKQSLSLLFVGETNIVHMMEFKGLDHFTTTRYLEHASIIQKVFEKEGHQFTHIPCHTVHIDFPNDMETLKQYDVVIFSDVGSNTMLLHPDYTKRTVNPLKLVKEYVADGGAFAMIGGYLSYQGFEGRAKYKNTHIEDILPVNIQSYDDRTELPEGTDLLVDPGVHEILEGFPREWPHIFGYNRVSAKDDAQVLVKSDRGDPIIAIGEYGNGRTLAYTTDCVQDWASPELLEWEHYGKLWDRQLRWLAKKL